MKGEAKEYEKEQAMRPRKHPKQARVVIPPPIEGARSSAKVPAPAIGSTVSHAARPPRAEPDRGAPPRLSVPDRQQLLSAMTIDELLEPDHPARAVWAYVEGLDLTPLFDRIRARGRVAGRPAIDPRLLVALWLYATLSGFTGARELADLCLRHDAFRWLAGGVSVNYHTLADFRTDHPAFVEQLLKQSVEVLRQQGLIDLDRIAQDGLRVRASAGAASFHRRETLERLLEEAQAELQELRRESAANAAHPVGTRGVAAGGPPAGTPDLSPQEAAAMRHAEGRVERVEQALERMPEMEAKIKPGDKKEARVSTTDPQATVMKMADGGFRPAYNLEYATTCDGQVVVGVDVVTVGSDRGQMPPMLDQIEDRFERRPNEVLIDGGFVSLEDIERVQSGGKCKVYAPVAKPRKETVNRHEPKATDSEGVAEWRKRMGTKEAQEIYKARAATAECINAQARNRGLQQFMVRGLEKVKSVATWFAIAQNMARSFALKPQPG
jgi:transposase